MARPVRHQQIDIGGIRAVKHGAPWGPGDIYYELMEMGWRTFIAAVTATFIVINLVFGAIYALMPGAIDNMPHGSLFYGFFFSVETIATVGYGNMAPKTVAGHAVAVVEILTGLFMTATLTGLIFQRFARPRDGMMFSDKLVIVDTGEQRLAMIRLAGTRARPLADVTARIGLLENVTLPTGREFRRSRDLPLVNAQNAMMLLAWTLVHVIDADSPLAGIIDSDAPLRITVTVRGLDTLLSNQVFASKIYERENIRVDHEFVDIFEYKDDGTIHLDLSRLHETRPASDPRAAASPN
jgi:inward rectifier potassium channel